MDPREGASPFFLIIREVTCTRASCFCSSTERDADIVSHWSITYVSSIQRSCRLYRPFQGHDDPLALEETLFCRGPIFSLEEKNRGNRISRGSRSAACASDGHFPLQRVPVVFPPYRKLPKFRENSIML